MRRILLMSVIIMVSWVSAVAQAYDEESQDTLPENVLLEKQWYLGATIHSNGWGVKFRDGWNLTALHQFMWEIEFVTYKSSKEIRSVNPNYSDSKSYIYGKLNYLGFLKGGVGSQNILNRKPYWGGVQLSAFYFGGLSLGITKPVYLYIVHFASDSTTEITEERYDPSSHYPEIIYGRGSFLSGITKLNFYPAVYAKTGLDFEFGTHSRSLESLEAGADFTYSPIGIPIMANNPKQNFFLTLYISLNIGKRHN
ncbi:MAG: hypothetical protein Q8867_00140 [Bacteroidota bacterium]|nr:hypothetical protein [Bacteroidota bacterium]